MREFDPKVSPNPFLAHRDVFWQDYGAAVRLRRLVLHLYNSLEYRVDLPYLLRSTDGTHRDVVYRLLAWYEENGENCPDFMEVARDLAHAFREGT